MTASPTPSRNAGIGTRWIRYVLWCALVMAVAAQDDGGDGGDGGGGGGGGGPPAPPGSPPTREWD
ncbi:hypothetical protein JCM24511_03854 [Saitozyma sp. JCM 24511]|nr:hypothetical protein JCM24511_03854 [Saitozyma sp. JCM 24511]